MNILITGAKGYAGSHLAEFLSNCQENIDRLSLRDNTWRNIDFRKYDVIIHCAALIQGAEPHASMKRYMDVNYRLTKELADKAKHDGVAHFVFFSTCAVYGLTGDIGIETVIDCDTPLRPNNEYGISKLKAEEYLQTLSSASFTVSIIRLPMIYGKDARGFYDKLQVYARYIPFVLNINHHRTAVHVNHLVRDLYEVIQVKQCGIIHIFDDMPLVSNDIIEDLRSSRGKRTIKVGIPRIVFPLMRQCSILNRMYGNLTISNHLRFVKK